MSPIGTFERELWKRFGWSFIFIALIVVCGAETIVYRTHSSAIRSQRSKNFILNKMGKKRAAGSDPEESSSSSEDEVMNGGDDDHDDESEDFNDIDDEEMTEAESKEESDGKMPTPNNGMNMRSGRSKRRRSFGTTGLTPPENSKRSKRMRMSTVTKAERPNATDADADISAYADKKESSMAFADSAVVDSNTPVQVDANGKIETSAKSTSSAGSPAAAPDPRRISYSAAISIPSNAHDDKNDTSSNKEELQELDVVPPKHVARTNGTTQNDSTTIVVEQQNQASTVHQLPPRNEKEVEKDEEQKKKEERQRVQRALGETLDTTNSTSTGASTLQRLVIIVVLGYISLLCSVPEVIKLTQKLVPLDDSILPPPRKITTDGTLPDEPEEEVEVDPSIALQSWNEKFLRDFEKFNEAKMGFSSSKQSLEVYYGDLLDHFEKIEAHFQPLQDQIEERLNKLNHLEDLLIEVDVDQKFDKRARDLALQLLGKTLVTTSSIKLWDFAEDIEADCHLLIEENNGSVDSPIQQDEKETESFLSANVLKEKEEALMLRSTMTAEKFIGGSVAEDRIRKWVKSRIEKLIDNEEEAVESIEDIKSFSQELSEVSTQTVQSDSESDSILSQIIVNRVDVHRADTTGIYDHASLKNGAEIIYGGKRGTSKSLIDELPIINRILQKSNLRFYGFGPEAALTATYPLSALGQCWSFRQTPLKDQLKERQLFENDDLVPNDFKRGNFGTLTIRLSEAILVDSVIIENASLRVTKQPESAIRSFRVVGYEDELASSKAWNLGSFEYNLKENTENNEYLQRFEVATKVFGKEIPPLRAISLAVDSNYGHDYACLYRFRVHGTKE